MRVERRLEGSGSKGTVGDERWLYINGRAQSRVSHHFRKIFCAGPCVRFRFVSSSSWSGVPFSRIRRSTDLKKKSIGPLPHLSEKEIPLIALTQPHFIPPLFFFSWSLFYPPARLSPLRPRTARSTSPASGRC